MISWIRYGEPRLAAEVDAHGGRAPDPLAMVDRLLFRLVFLFGSSDITFPESFSSAAVPDSETEHISAF